MSSTQKSMQQRASKQSAIRTNKPVAIKANGAGVKHILQYLLRMRMCVLIKINWLICDGLWSESVAQSIEGLSAKHATLANRLSLKWAWWQWAHQLAYGLLSLFSYWLLNASLRSAQCGDNQQEARRLMGWGNLRLWAPDKAPGAVEKKTYKEPY